MQAEVSNLPALKLAHNACQSWSPERLHPCK